MSFFASRAILGVKTIIVIGTRRDTIDTDYNTTDYAKFINVTSDANGTLRIGLTHAGTWQYIAGFSIKENLLDSKITEPENNLMNNANTETSKNNNREFTLDAADKGNVVFPNPFKDKLSILIGKSVTGNYKIVLTAATGAVLWSRQANKTTAAVTENINTAKLPSGIYLLQVINNGVTQTYKVIKN